MEQYPVSHPSEEEWEQLMAEDNQYNYDCVSHTPEVGMNYEVPAEVAMSYEVSLNITQVKTFFNKGISIINPHLINSHFMLNVKHN